MKRRIWIYTGLSFLIFLNSCVSNNVLADAHAADNNVNRLSRISLRMNQEEVLAIMHAPYEKETYRVGEDRYDVWFYVTTVTVLGQSRMVPKNLTPLTFRNQQLVGVGYDYYHWVQKREPVRPRPARIEEPEDKELEQQLKKAFTPDSTTAPQKNQTNRPANPASQPSPPVQPSQSVPSAQPTSQQPASNPASDLKLGPPPYVPSSRPKAEEAPAKKPVPSNTSQVPVTQSEVEGVHPDKATASQKNPPAAPAIPPQQPQPSRPQPNQPSRPIQPTQPSPNTPPPTYDPPKRPTSQASVQESLKGDIETSRLDQIAAPQPAQPAIPSKQPQPNRPSQTPPGQPAQPQPNRPSQTPPGQPAQPQPNRPSQTPPGQPAQPSQPSKSPQQPNNTPQPTQPAKPMRPQQTPNQPPSNAPSDLHRNPAPNAPPLHPSPAQQSTMSKAPEQTSDKSSEPSSKKKIQTRPDPNEQSDPEKKPDWDKKDEEINGDAMDQDFNYW